MPTWCLWRNLTRYLLNRLKTAFDFVLREIKNHICSKDFHRFYYKKLEILTNFGKETLYLNETQLECTFVLLDQRYQPKQLLMKCNTSLDACLDMSGNQMRSLDSNL